MLPPAPLHSELDPDEARDLARDLTAGALDLLYVSPERLMANGTLERLSRLPVSLVAIDEAHCVSQWGHEFRPDYRALSCLPEHFPGAPRIALTATADARTRRDIVEALRMPTASVFVASFHRPNLFLTAAPKVSETAQLLDLLARHRDACGIVYCGSRAKTERVAAGLAKKGIEAIAFHAGLDAAHKRAALARFRSGEPVFVVATIAFGMGIDRPDVRFVAHLDMPDSPEAYYQQIGRAGRDGDRSETLLLHGAGDIAQARHWLTQSAAPEAQKRVRRTKLEEMIALTEAVGCRTRTLLGCFGEELADPCDHCDNCAAPPRTEDATREAQKALSAIYRTGQMFGTQHLIAVLRGERTETVLRHGHDRLPVFGVGADRPATFWRGLLRQLTALGAIDVDTAGHGGVFLVADKARPILRGESGFRHRETIVPPRPARHRDGAARIPGEPSAPDTPAFERLRAWRASEAKAQRVPPYVIFHDTTLREIAAACPATEEALAQIKGVGASKLARYGAAVLATLRMRAG